MVLCVARGNLGAAKVLAIATSSKKRLLVWVMGGPGLLC